MVLMERGLLSIQMGSTNWVGVADFGERLESIMYNEIIHNCYLGSDGAYFVCYGDYKVSYKGLPNGVIKHLSNGSKKVKQVMVDEENHNFFIRYS